MVMTRCPRRCSSAHSRTVSVVFPLCFLPITATIGGRAMSLREDPLLGRIDVHEENSRVAELCDVANAHARDTNVVVERDDATVTRCDAPFDRTDAGRRIIRTQ